jgi:hypothetical protein
MENNYEKLWSNLRDSLDASIGRLLRTKAETDEITHQTALYTTECIIKKMEEFEKGNISL